MLLLNIEHPWHLYSLYCLYIPPASCWFYSHKIQCWGGGVTQITMDPISYRMAHLKKSTPKLRPTSQDLLMNWMTGGWWFQPTPSEKYDREIGKIFPKLEMNMKEIYWKPSPRWLLLVWFLFCLFSNHAPIFTSFWVIWGTLPSISTGQWHQNLSPMVTMALAAWGYCCIPRKCQASPNIWWGSCLQLCNP